MNFSVNAYTDVGIRKTTNQDSYAVQSIQTQNGKIVFALLCDGMGGLQKGEVASASVIKAFQTWVSSQLPQLCGQGFDLQTVEKQWTAIILDMNEKIAAYGRKAGLQLGTTATAILMTQEKYLIVHVGDSRVYEITGDILKLTHDQTVVAREVAQGIMTEEQAEVDSRRNVLLQCIGASRVVVPEVIYGDTKVGALYLLCSDGFRHTISSQEIFQYLSPAALPDDQAMIDNAYFLVETNKQRGETDNITVVLVRTV